MRNKTLAASALALLLVAATATAAGAVGATFTWDQQTSTDLQLATNWSTDVAPGTDDNLVFPAGTTAAVNGQVNFDVRSLAFQAPTFALTGSPIILNEGLSVAGDATISNPLTLSDAQTWAITSGSLQVTGSVDVPVGLLTIDSDGVTVLDGALGGIGNALKTGSGLLAVRGGGLIQAIQLTEGEMLLRSQTPNLEVEVTGGMLSGGNLGNVGNSQNLYSVQLLGGAVSPGPDAQGHGIGTLWLDGPFDGAPGTALNIELDGVASDILHSGDNVDLNDTALVVSLANAPAVGTRYTIIEGNTFSATTLTYAGVGALTDLTTFVSGTHQFRIEYLAESVDLVYLGEVGLPPTGVDATGALALVAVLLLAGIGTVAAAARRRRTV